MERIATLVDEEKPAENYTAELNAEEFSSGTYIYTLTSGKFATLKTKVFLMHRDHSVYI